MHHAVHGNLLVSGDETLKNSLISKWSVARKAMLAARYPTLVMQCRTTDSIEDLVAMDRHYGKHSISVVKFKNKETNK